MDQTNTLSKTSLCKFLQIGCKYQSTCRYAHSKDELQFKFCKFRENCDNSNCGFIHPDNIPDKDEYYNHVISQTNIIPLRKPNSRTNNSKYHHKRLLKRINNDTQSTSSTNETKVQSNETNVEKIACWADECDAVNVNDVNDTIVLLNATKEQIDLVKNFCKENQIEFI